MIWGNSTEALSFELNNIKEKNVKSGLIHWAGCTRIPYVAKMLRGDILVFFENYYYSKMPNGNIRRLWKNTIAFAYYAIKKNYKSVLKVIIGIFKNDR